MKMETDCSLRFPLPFLGALWTTEHPLLPPFSLTMSNLLCDNGDRAQFVLREPVFFLLLPVVLSTCNCQFPFSNTSLFLAGTVTMTMTTFPNDGAFGNLVQWRPYRRFNMHFFLMSE